MTIMTTRTLIPFLVSFIGISILFGSPNGWTLLISFVISIITASLLNMPRCSNNVDAIKHTMQDTEMTPEQRKEWNIFEQTYLR